MLTHKQHIEDMARAMTGLPPHHTDSELRTLEILNYSRRSKDNVNL